MTLHVSLLSVLRMSERILPVLYLHKEEVMQQSLFVFPIHLLASTSKRKMTSHISLFLALSASGKFY